MNFGAGIFLSVFEIAESLQSLFILTMSHWSSGLPICFQSQGTGIQIPWGILTVCETRILLAVSHYIGDPDVIDNFWGGLRPEPTVTWTSCRQCDNPAWSHTAFLSWFHARCRSSFWLHNRRSQLLGGEPCGEPAISLHSHHVSLVQWTTRLLPITRDPG